MSFEARRFWGVDLHLHTPDINPTGDARENHPSAIRSAMNRLLRERVVNAVSYLCHDGFPDRSVEETRASTDSQVLVGNEISARIPPSSRKLTRKILVPMVHLVGVFPQKPDWPFPEPQWPKSWRDKLRFMSEELPVLEEVITAVRDSGGVLVLAHPSPSSLPRAMGKSNIIRNCQFERKRFTKRDRRC